MFNLFKKKPKFYSAKILNKDKEFKVSKGKNLLAAALDDGINWPHKCRVGSCGSCKYKLIKGKISPDIDFGYVLSFDAVSYTHLRAHETPEHLVCRLLLEKKKKI